MSEDFGHASDMSEAIKKGKHMRAKVRVSSVSRNIGEGGNVASETVCFSAVSKSGSYPSDGSDEDNTYARWTPNASLSFTITNPDLFEAFVPGQKYYVDFKRAD